MLPASSLFSAACTLEGVNSVGVSLQLVLGSYQDYCKRRAGTSRDDRGSTLVL